MVQKGFDPFGIEPGFDSPGKLYHNSWVQAGGIHSVNPASNHNQLVTKQIKGNNNTDNSKAVAGYHNWVEIGHQNTSKSLSQVLKEDAEKEIALFLNITHYE